MKPPIDPFRCELLAAVPALRAWCHRLARDPDKAADLLHDTIARALKFERNFTMGTSMRSWLGRIAINIHRSTGTRANRMVQILPGFAESIPIEPDAIDRLALQDVLAAMNKLPPKQQIALVLAGEGYDYAEIARRQGVPVGTAKSRVSRARDAVEHAR